MVARHCATCLAMVALGLGPVAAAPAPPAAQPPAPRLLVSPGSPGGAQLHRSWPLLLEATLWLEPGAGEPAPLRLTARQGAWRDALTVTVRHDQGAPAAWPLHPVPRAGAELLLEPDRAVTVAWWLTAEETAALAPGDYEVTVTLDPQRIDGLPAPAHSEVWRLQVVAEPTPLSADLQQEKLYLLGRLALLQGEVGPVAGLVDQLLRLDPQSVGARRLQAAVLVRAGQPAEALRLLDEALALYFRRFPNACPPAALLAERDAVLEP